MASYLHVLSVMPIKILTLHWKMFKNWYKINFLATQMTAVRRVVKDI